jgi:hypothetical protein
MFAELQLPDPNHFSSIGWACVILVMIVTGIRQIVGLRNDLKDRPTGAEALATAQGNFATQGALTSLEVKIEEQRKASEESRARIYARMDKQREEFDAKLTDLGEALGNKIEVLPDRVISILKNTGNLRP